MLEVFPGGIYEKGIFSREKNIYNSLLFDNVWGFSLKKTRWLPLGDYILAKYPLFVTSTTQPQNVALDLGYSLMINYKYF